MKKLLLSFLSTLSIATTAQTLTYMNHAPAWGNIPYQTMQCDSVGIAPGASGASAAWSFSPTNIHSLKTYSTSNTSPTNTVYPLSNVSVASSAADIAYYNTNTNSFKYYGGNITINTYILNVVYASPALYALYPMSLNSATTSVTSGTVNVLAPVTFSQTFTGNCSVLADGTGTLVLPAKTFTDVIKVITTQTITSSAATVYMANFDYYSIGTSKAPVFSIQTSTINAIMQPSSTQTIVTVQKDYEFVGIKENSKNSIELSVFPNPATNFVNFSTISTEAVKITAFDVTGKIVATEIMETGKAKMNTSHLTSGVYMYHVIGKNNMILTTGKFNVTK